MRSGVRRALRAPPPPPGDAAAIDDDTACAADRAGEFTGDVGLVVGRWAVA